MDTETRLGVAMLEAPIDNTITSTVDFCRNFPKAPKKSINRDNLTEEVRRTLESDVSIVVIVGEALSGKTEFCAEYMREHSEDCIALFLDLDSPYGRTTNYGRLALAEQISWLTEHVSLQLDSISDEDYMRRIYKLQRRGKHKKITWIIDGLLQSNAQNEGDATQLLNLLPLSIREFNFIFTSSTVEHAKRLLPAATSTKTMELPTVSPDQARGFLSDIVTEESDVKEIRLFCKSIVGRMQLIRKILLSGSSIDDLLNKQSDSLEAIFDFEWNLIPRTNESHILFATLAFSAKPLKLSILSKLTEIDDVAKITAVLSRSGLVTRLVAPDGDIQFSIDSQSHRIFIVKRLEHLKQRIDAATVKLLLSDPTAREYTTQLPLELVQAGQHAELLEKLDRDHFIRLLESEQTLRALKQHADFGREAARKLGDYSQEFAFSLISSSVTGLTFSVASLEQIDALIRLGTPERAIEIASIALTGEERLHLLSRVAREMKDQDLAIPSEIKENIQSLVDSIDLATLGTLGVNIACDLISTDMKTAYKVFNAVAIEANQEINKIDRLGLSESRSGSMKDSEESKGSKQVSEHDRQRFTRAAIDRIQGFRAETVLKRALEETSTFGLSLLQMWLRGNSSGPEACKVANAALDLVLGDTTHSPQIEDLRKISSVLRYITDMSEATALAARIEAQYGILGSRRVSIESVRLKMHLYVAAHPSDKLPTELKIIDLYIEIESIEDVSTKTACWAWMLTHLCRFTLRNELEKDTSLIRDVSSRLKESIDDLLEKSADHFFAARGAIDALAQDDADQALELVRRLNTVTARDRGYEQLVRTLSYRSNVDTPILLSAWREITDDILRSRTIVESLLILDRAATTATPRVVLDPMLCNIWAEIEIAPYKIQALAICLSHSIRSGDSARADLLKPLLIEVWSAVYDESTQVEQGYMVAGRLVVDDPELAKEWMLHTERLVESKTLTSDSVKNLGYSMLGICCRLYAAIATKSSTSGEEQSFRCLASLISALPSIELSTRLWTDLATRAYLNGNDKLCQYVHEKYITKSLEGDFKHNTFLREHLIADSAVAAYFSHPATAIQRIDSMGSAMQRDRARGRIINCIFRRTPWREPYREVFDSEYKVSQQDVTDIVLLLEGCTRDSTIFGVVDDLCRSIASDHNKAKITRNFALDSIGRIEKLVNLKLPDPSNIKHEGFLVAAKTAVLRARDIIVPKGKNLTTPAWELLYAQARKIVNVADRSVVTAMIGSVAKYRPESVLNTWFSDVKSDIKKIPSLLDRMERYEWIARIVERSDRQAARTLITECLSIKTDAATADVVDAQQKILDLAYSIDPQFSKELIERFDTDEARQEGLNKRFKQNDSRKSMASHPDAFDFDNMSDEEISKLCNDNLGSLNAGRINSHPIENFMSMIRRSASMSLQDSSIVWSWVVMNSIAKRGPGAHATSICDRLFEAACRSVEIAFGLIGRIHSKPNYSLEVGGTIQIGEREQFIEALRVWAADQGESVIRISDPYFGIREMDIVYSMFKEAPTASFRIATSRETVRKYNFSSVEDSFLSAWQDLSDIDPPNITIAIVGFGTDGRHPIHDRWIVSDKSGWRLGSSINSLGISRISDLSPISFSDSKDKANEIDKIFFNPAREFNQQRLSVTTFTI